MPSCLLEPLAASGRLLGAQRCVAGSCERLVERALEVADVVGLPDRRGVRFAELGDQVLAAHLGRVHADLGGEHVHRPLGRRRRLRPAGAAVRGDRRGVGDDAGRAALDVGDVVDRRRHRPGHERGEDRADLDEATAVLDGVQPVVGDLAVAVAADRDVLDLGPAVAERHHRLGAGLAPAQRAADRLESWPSRISSG